MLTALALLCRPIPTPPKHAQSGKGTTAQVQVGPTFPALTGLDKKEVWIFQGLNIYFYGGFFRLF